MVYCGKPSKGCLACRSRKTRCDRQTPACSQCIRAKRECPGYRNQLDLMFRNESEAVIGKATSRKPRRSKSSSATANGTPRSSTPNTKTVVSSPKRDQRTHEYFLPLLNAQDEVPGSLSPSLQDRALSFYRNREAIWLRNFDMVESLCSQSNTEEYLIAALSAVGLASYATSVRSPKLLLRARRDYGQALQLTNAALKSPVKYTNDSTLFAVMALGVFEAVAGNGRESLDAWSKHLAGASELVKLRGPAQFFSEAGQRMFGQINSNLIFQCITNGLKMPEHIQALRKMSEPFVDTMDTGWRISDEIIKFTDLRAKVKTEKDFDRRAVVNQTLQMDATFSDIADKRPPHWRGKIVRDDSAPMAIWDGYYVVYYDFWVAQMMNTMRIFRIHTLDILREQLQADDQHLVFPPEEAADLEQKAVNTMLEMQRQILASVPQYAPWGVKSYPSTSPIEPWHAYQVLWPLYLAANMDITSHEVSQWVLRRFQTIAAEGGIEHASVFAQAMMRRLQLNADGSSMEGLSRPLKMDPFDWSSEGWAIVHATILSAQINKPKTPPSSPKATEQAIPPGWKGGPPPGWKGGPPPGWTGPPPPGWKPGMGGPPTAGIPNATNHGVSGLNSTQDMKSQIPAGWKGGPPPGWKGPPPPGWKPGMGGPPSAISSGQLSENTVPQAMETMMSQIPAGWKGGPPPGWKGPPPPGWKPGMGGPPSATSNGQNLGGPASKSMQTMMSQIPAGWKGPPPPGWKPGMAGPPASSTANGQTSPELTVTNPQQNTRSQVPAGWKGGPPPGWTGPPPPGWKPGMLGPPTNSMNAGGSQGIPAASPPQDLTTQIPSGWTGPPPPGWTPGVTESPSLVSTTRNGTSQSNSAPGPQQNKQSQIPSGWTGPPPPGWNPGMSGPPTLTPPSDDTSADLAMQNLISQIPAGWTGPPPPGWNPNTLSPPVSDGTNAPSTSNLPSHNKPKKPEMGAFGIPVGWTGPPPPGWKMPPGFGGK